MAEPTTNIPAEESIVRHIAANPATVDMLIQRGVSRRWFSDPLFRAVVEASIRLRMSGKRVDPLSIMSFSFNGVPPERWGELITIWQEPSPPGDAPDTFIEPLQDAILLRDFDEAMAEARAHRAKQPREVRQWLPYILNLLTTLTQDRAYDARPSSHYTRDSRDVIGTIGIPHLDRALKGGLWSASTNLFIGISNHGKSTLAYTIAAKMVERGIKTVFVSTEMPPSEVAIGVLRPLGGWSDRQVRLRQVDVSAQFERIDRYLASYNYEYASAEALARIVYWERPKVIIYDYLKAPDSEPYKREDQALTALVEGIREINIDHGTCTLMMAQFSDSKATEFRNTHDVKSPAPFGSARVFHAADQVLIMRRHWLMPETEFFKVKKDKLPPTYEDANLLDWEFLLGHDTRTRSFWQRDSGQVEF